MKNTIKSFHQLKKYYLLVGLIISILLGVLLSIAYSLINQNSFIGIFVLFGAILITVAYIYTYFYIVRIKETTLCFIVRGDKVLMMHRVLKQNDVHEGKWNGIGGSFEEFESPEDCLHREVKEEIGVKLKNYNFVGKVKFNNFAGKIGQEIMYCYVAYDYDGEILTCDEGKLYWVDKNQVLNRPLWEGDQHFLMHIINNEPFNGVITYDQDKVVFNHIELVNDKNNN
ncbi:NUDIX hydrolase [Haloplasma contractile]|uniref:NAD+ diphosphatase protein n=1 Tax=Haloplasma contractile SSD-17B TaxID=1033810 RepID=F7PWJ0_9MOLU|nr:8-oxo-dGTP diphosphatase [Haloplasma contractile]ERJ10972.1 NAD+ diphosphatase protein [Haloplasma contractile SSD-17B]